MTTFSLQFQASVLLYQASSEADVTSLLHVIIWSSVGGILLLVFFVIILYFVSERICSKIFAYNYGKQLANYTIDRLLLLRLSPALT